MIVKYISKFILWILGWKIDIRIPPEKKYVIIVAPHTSNWDYFIGKLTNWATGLRPKVLVKKEAFTFFAGPFVRAWGGIPVDRSNSMDIIEQISKMFEENEVFVLGITPEGTRQRNPNWKTGFYRIAIRAGVPIYFGYINYATKSGGMHQRFMPTGDMEKDIKKIKAYYKDMKGKFPDQFAIE
jgi:1-acyl-sn-glycerol-3-phosphate acyltransferase